MQTERGYSYIKTSTNENETFPSEIFKPTLNKKVTVVVGTTKVKMTLVDKVE